MTEPLCWIETLEEAALTPEARARYDPLRRPDGTLHNLYRTYSLFTAPLPPADQLYRVLLQDPDAPLPLWLSELISTQVAVLTGCAYAEAHHGRNLGTRLGDHDLGRRMIAALHARDYGAAVFEPRVGAMLTYGEKLTLRPAEMSREDVAALRAQGVSDAEILHLNQVSANFAYWVRVINGLGIALGDEKIGLEAAQ